MQIEVEKNVYFQQCGDTISGVYVNEPFINIKVSKKELSKKELQSIATQIYDICKNSECIRSIIEGFAQEYESNPNRDGVLFILTDEKMKELNGD